MLSFGGDVTFFCPTGDSARRGIAEPPSTGIAAPVM
jgi:hypothetical protein